MEVDEPQIHRDFDSDLLEFCNARRMAVPKFILMSKEVDTYKMYKSVQERGGYRTVTSKNTWKFVFLECTGSSNFSSNTGYYTRLAYERHLLDFDKSRPNPFPQREVTDSERTSMKAKRKSRPASSAGPQSGGGFGFSGGVESPRSASSLSLTDYSSDEDAEIDENALTVLLEFDWDKPLEQLPNDCTTEEREKWYEECEGRMKIMQDHYRTLKRYLSKIDRKLGYKTRGSHLMPIPQTAESAVASSSEQADSNETENRSVEATKEESPAPVDAAAISSEVPQLAQEPAESPAPSVSESANEQDASVMPSKQERKSMKIRILTPAVTGKRTKSPPGQTSSSTEDESATTTVLATGRRRRSVVADKSLKVEEETDYESDATAEETAKKHRKRRKRNI